MVAEQQQQQQQQRDEPLVCKDIPVHGKYLNKPYSENFYQTNWNCNLAKHLTKLLSSLTTLEYIIPNTEHLVDFLEQQTLSDDCEFISFDVTSLLMIASLFHLVWQVYLQAYTVAHYWCYPSKNLWRKTGIYKHTKKREKLSSLTVYKKCSFYIHFQRKMLSRARWWLEVVELCSFSV